MKRFYWIINIWVWRWKSKNILNRQPPFWNFKRFQAPQQKPLVFFVFFCFEPFSLPALIDWNRFYFYSLHFQNFNIKSTLSNKIVLISKLLCAWTKSWWYLQRFIISLQSFAWVLFPRKLELIWCFSVQALKQPSNSHWVNGSEISIFLDLYRSLICCCIVSC